jgi:hypothetical protein
LGWLVGVDRAAWVESINQAADESGAPARAVRIGVVLSGGQAAGGHNVIAGVYDRVTENGGWCLLLFFTTSAPPKSFFVPSWDGMTCCGAAPFGFFGLV